MRMTTARDPPRICEAARPAGDGARRAGASRWRSRLAQRVPSQVEMTELISVGVLGLIDAAGRYKPSLGVPFDAFARRRIHGAMLDALRELDWAPRSVRKLRRDVDGDHRAAAARARPRARGAPRSPPR